MEIEILRAKERAPIVYINTLEKNGKMLLNEIKAKTNKSFHLVLCYPESWNSDLSPWKENAMIENGEDFSGNANRYLSGLVEKIEEIEKDIDIEYRAIAGYSLSGLFSLYAAYKTDLFRKIASVSGSLWYPRLLGFVKNNEISFSITHAYFSLGDKECHTNIEKVRCVEENTKTIEKHLREKGITTTFELNRGNHFKAVLSREAKAIAWLLNSDKEDPSQQHSPLSLLK